MESIFRNSQTEACYVLGVPSKYIACGYTEQLEDEKQETGKEWD